MDRRGFLRLLSGVAALPVVKPLMKFLPEPAVQQAVIGEYADYITFSDLTFQSAISYNVKYAFGPPPDIVSRMRKIQIPDSLPDSFDKPEET